MSRQTRDLYFTGIEDTPFTLVLSIPTQYGKYRLQTRSEDEIHREFTKGSNVLDFFNDRWKIHPDWYVKGIKREKFECQMNINLFSRLYCKHNNETFSSPEAELLYFLERMRKPGWHWPLRPLPPEKSHAQMSGGSQCRFIIFGVVCKLCHAEIIFSYKNFAV